MTGKPAPAFAGLFSHFLTRQRLRQALPYLKGSILDIGCGRANVLEYIAPEQAYVGVDRDENIYQWLLKNHPEREFHQMNVAKQNLNLGRKFDTILMLAVIEHLTQPQKALRQASAHLNPGGKLLITTPSPLGDRIHRFGARFRLFSPLAVKDHETIFTRESLQTLLSECGLRLEKYQQFLLGGNQLFICTKKSGRKLPGISS
jgi:2-polyprenyl-3-methyl-5-hydroxy-6-metoxy-1,4-benzoquinol methylase